MPLVVEISVAFSILIAFSVFGVFVFRIRERLDTVIRRAGPPAARPKGCVVMTGRDRVGFLRCDGAAGIYRNYRIGAINVIASV
jgi:hypothetical protein